MARIRVDARAATSDLDDRLHALDQEMIRAQEESARLHEQRLLAQLRASLPDGGTLATELWFDEYERDSGVFLLQILDPEGAPYPGLDRGQDWASVLGVEVEDTIRTDVEAAFDARASRWSEGTARFDF